MTKTNPKTPPINRDSEKSSSISNTTSNLRVKDPELAKVLINQLSILLTTVDSSSVDSHYKQIRFIFKKIVRDPIVLNNYFEKLFGFIRFSDFNSPTLSPIESLFAKELDFIATELNFTTYSAFIWIVLYQKNLILSILLPNSIVILF